MNHPDDARMDDRAAASTIYNTHPCAAVAAIVRRLHARWTDSRPESSTVKTLIARRFT